MRVDKGSESRGVVSKYFTRFSTSGPVTPMKLVLYLCVHGVVVDSRLSWSFLAGKNIVGNIITFMAFLQKRVLGISFAFSVEIGFLSKDLSR